MEATEAEFRSMLAGMLPRLRRFSHALARDADAGEDLARSAAAHALEQRARYRPGLRFDAWLFQLTRNLWFDHLCRRRARPEIIDAEAAMRGADPRSLTTAASAEPHALAARATKAFQQLPDTLRETAALVMIEGFTYQETASALGVHIDLLMSRVARARAAVACALYGEDARAQSERERIVGDDILSALIDSELEPAEAERAELLIAQDPLVAQRVERLRRADVYTQKAFEPLVSVPLELRAAAGAFDPWRRFAAAGAAALAAGAAGLALGASLSRDDVGRLLALNNGVAASADMARALDETASGGETCRGGVRVAPLYSFRDRDGRACRVFHASLRNSAIEAVACREGGSWRLAALAPAAASSDRFNQAGADDARAIESAVDALGPTEITGVEERALIARGWAVK